MSYIDTSTDNINLGIDMDGTLTKEVLGYEILYLSQAEIEKAMLDCTPKDGIDVLFQRDLNIHIYIITGRQEKFRNVTIDWLDIYGIPYKEINMSPYNVCVLNRYTVPTYTDWKLEMHIQKNIHLSLDDSEQVINVLNENGIPACKVDNSFRDAFEKVFELNSAKYKHTKYKKCFERRNSDI